MLSQHQQHSNLVRPRTIMSHQPSSSATVLNEKRNERSFIILSLCGASLFLLVLCVCLMTALVLIGKNLSAQELVDNESFLSSTVTKINNNRSGTFDKTPGDNSVSIKPILLKTIVFSSDQSEQNNNRNNYPRNMAFPIVSKVLDQLTWRLPREIKPKFYELLLHPDLKSKTFSGNVSIHVELSKPMSYIAVHANKLSITQTIVKQQQSELNQTDGSSSYRNISVANAFSYPEFEYWVTELAEPLDVGKYILQLTFNGSLTDRIVGLYGSSYWDPQSNSTR